MLPLLLGGLASRRWRSRRAPRRTGSSARRTCRSPCGCSAGRRRSCSSSRSSRCRRCGRRRSCRSSTGGALFALPTALEWLASLVGVGLFALVLYSGFAGAQVAAGELLGDVHLRDLLGRHAGGERAVRRRVPRAQPVAHVRARARWRSRALSRAASRRERPPLRYPEWLGMWPAVAGIVGFAWLELVYVRPRQPVDAGGAVARLLPRDARRDGAVRRRGVGRAGGRLRRVLQPALAARRRSCAARTASLYLRRPLSGVTDLRDPAGHGHADLRADRHDDVRRLQQRRHLAQQRAEPAEPVRRPRLQPDAGARSSPTRSGCVFCILRDRRRLPARDPRRAQRQRPLRQRRR